MAGLRAEHAVNSAEQQKHNLYDSKCKDLNWLCVPMAVDTYGVWGKEARDMIGQVGHQLAAQLNMSPSVSISFIYNVLGVVLARKNANALLAKAPVQKFGKGDVAAFGCGDKNNMDPVVENAAPFSSVRVRCVQNPRLLAVQQRAAADIDIAVEDFNAVGGVYDARPVPASLSFPDLSPSVPDPVSPSVPDLSLALSDSPLASPIDD